ncbi:MAG: Kdo hydroxylase family protein [Alphaproteobacteria bacterium]|nr:Kdo hydroxylase family protein [Alphaproteobacteria bacterium]
MDVIQFQEYGSWHDSLTKNDLNVAAQNLEQGKVLYFPALSFELQDTEDRLLSPDCLKPPSKNISFDFRSGILKGSMHESPLALNLIEMLKRFSEHSLKLIEGVLPHYCSQLSVGRTSYRPAEISGRTSSYRKDDTRLHVDAFPSAPNQGHRILRVFSNINPHGQSRVWRLGEPFEEVARQFLPRIRKPLFGSSALLKALNITKSRRTPYDHYMLRMHDLMKGDLDYQIKAHQCVFQFPPNSTWIVMTDHVSHAAMAGQYVLEQTFYLPVSGMLNENLSPLRILERMTGCNLV